MADVTVDPECNNPKELFAQGVRAYILQDFEVAIAALSKASELLVEEHKDDMHESLGEIHLYYGKSLLGLSREQNEALGDAVPKNSAEDSEEEGEEQDEEGGEVEEAEEKATTEAEPKEEQTPGGSSGEPGPSSSKEPEEDTAEGPQQNGDDEPTDLQVAWEVLELAKKIFEKQDDKKSLADTLITLGEVSLESENFESAINDIKQGLEIQKEIFAKDSRAVAETLYKLGMAYSTNSQMDEAIDSFKSSLEYLKNRIKTLEEIKVMSQEHKDEVDDIKGLIPDIEEKILDMGVYKEEAIKKLAETINGSSKESASTGEGPSSSKQVTDISHLVKRKRKLEGEEKSSEEIPPKKFAP